MSAIGGIITFEKPEAPISQYLRQIMSRQSHRGSDDEGYVFFQQSGFTKHHGSDTPTATIREKELLPLESASPTSWMALGQRIRIPVAPQDNQQHLPLSNPAKTAFIVFDGEILNARQLAEELRSEGISIEGHDSAEVVLIGYLAWKERILSKLEGSYSFVILDREENRLFGVRDRFGIAPFYYVNDKNIFAFASEQKCLIHLPFVSKKVSKSAVYDYLVLGVSESSNQSMFRGITELMPGSAFSMLLDTGNMKVWGYFHLTSDSKIDRYSRNKVSTLSYRLKKSLVNNISTHLSPGIKSAYHLNSSLESLIFPYLLKEFIEELPAKDRPKASDIYSGILGQMETTGEVLEKERQSLKKAIQDLDIQMLESVCTFKDFTENLEKIAYNQDVPFCSMDVFAQFKMMETAKKSDIHLIVESAGSEQLFSSGSGHYNQYLHDLWQRGEYQIFLDNYFGSSDPLKIKLSQLRSLVRDVIFRSSSDDVKETFIKASSEEFSYLKGSFTDRYFKNLDDKIKSSPLNLNQLLASELSGPITKERLRTSDRNANLTGVHVRHPFVSDREMAESMIKASSVYKIRSGVSGNILRKAMRGIFPDEIIRKGRFQKSSNKENMWLMQAQEELKSYLTTDLDDFIDSRKIKKDWDQLVSMADNNRNEFLWRVINLAIWRHVYFNT
ncbi:MAG TPA: asparagine synthase-related protein [Catalimonadaceae bacterium]|nr:asparagine synthase-related protein [Catalimonadaceae bacterium]